MVKGWEKYGPLIPAEQVLSKQERKAKKKAEKPIAAPAYQSATIAPAADPKFDLMALSPALKGQLRSRADLAAGQQIGNISRATGGNTASPAFQLLSTIARTGAAAQAGAEGAKLDFDAAATMGAQQLQRDQFNAQAAQEANRLALETTLGLGNLNLQREESRTRNTQFDIDARLRALALSISQPDFNDNGRTSLLRTAKNVSSGLSLAGQIARRQ